MTARSASASNNQAIQHGEVGCGGTVVNSTFSPRIVAVTLVASFTKSYKEAQTWLSVVLLAPTLPILVVSLLTLRPRLEFMFIPSLSQHLLLIDMVKNEPINVTHVVISVTSTLIFGGLLTWLCARLYRREGLLG